MKRIFLEQPKRLNSWEKGEIHRILSKIAKSPHPKSYTFVDSKDKADLIVILESASFKCHSDLDYYRGMIDQWSNHKMVLVINYEDAPPGSLPGAYSSLESFRFDPVLHISWPHMKFPNEHIVEFNNHINSEHAFLFSFVGSSSHPIRCKLFDMYEDKSTNIFVKEIKKWYNHDISEKISYINVIKKSAFVLCPRGIASYSHRILEVLALGRVPVIIADDWVPFSIEEEDYYIRIPEKDICRIEEILKEELHRYRQLQFNSHEIYNKYFRDDIRHTIAFEKLVELSERIPIHVDRKFLFDRLRSNEFHRINGWLIGQRFTRLLRRRWRQLQGLRPFRASS